jgi:PD-(D/E)XK endonuclease
MKYWQRFSSHKERGEWVELKFMTEAAQRRFTVSKPWGDTRAYDVGIEHGQNFLRVQVKSTCYRVDAGYRCKIVPDTRSDLDYSLRQIDLFAAYVIPEEVWYLIPAVLLLGERRKEAIMLCPVTPPHKEACYRYECYREKWRMLTRNRSELRHYANQAQPGL